MTQTDQLVVSNETTSSFAGFGLPDSLLEALKKCGYEQPSPIQAAAIPELMLGRDLLGQAQTCLLYTSPSPRDGLLSRMPSSA